MRKPTQDIGVPRWLAGRRAAGSQPLPPLRVALPVLMLLSVALLILSRLDHTAIRAVRWHITEALSPVLNAFTVPLDPLRRLGRRAGDLFDLVARLDALEAENRELKSAVWKAQELERRLGNLEAQAKPVTDVPAQEVLTRVIANSSGAFVRSAVINAGRDHGLKIGYPVVNADGLVGRIVEMGRRAASILLLNDLNSRIPVVVGAKRIRAVMVGDNGALPRLIFVGGDGMITAGDAVATSGVGGIFPRGLEVGTVVAVGGDFKVQPRAHLDELEYVRVIAHESATLQLTDETPLARATDATPLRGITPPSARRGGALQPKAAEELAR